MTILSFSDLKKRCSDENKMIYEIAQDEEISLLDMVNAYSTLASGGFKTNSHF